MDLTLAKNRFSLAPFLLFLFLLVAFWYLLSVFTEISGHVVYSVSSLETAQEISEQVKEENAEFTTKRSGGKKPSIKEEIEAAKNKLSKSDYKAAKSTYKQLVKHVDKLEKYRQNPMKYDNLGLLKNAPNKQIRQKIIQTRISHLEREIQTFYNNIVKIIY